jgi:peptidoglycan/xylan/chitin deacetylase (PgdA/CDA1 family)
LEKLEMADPSTLKSSGMRALVVALLAGLALTLLPAPLFGGRAAAETGGPSVVYFPATGHHVAEPFLSYWRTRGALPIFGYPLTELIERDGLWVQYFERARFEYHPENAGTPYEVLLTLVVRPLIDGRDDPPFQPFPADTPQPSDPQQHFFPETGHHLSYGFKGYWEARGGLAVFGYPLSEEFVENGLTVQYFERARFEWHPENDLPYTVLLGRLGADAALREGVDTSAVARGEGVPDYDPGLWQPEPRGLRVPVLMYHRFGDPADRYQMPYWKFEQQLDWLRANGYTTITLTQLYDYIAGIGDLPAKPVVLTIDDGFGSQWGAAEALHARGMVGVFFITTSQNGLDLAALASWGNEIGAHTIHHPDLTTLSDGALWAELADARATLQAWSGQPVDILAYPYGAYNERVIAAAKAAGYRAAVGAWGGQEWTPEKWWGEPRIEISGYLTLDEFVGYVW